MSVGVVALASWWDGMAGESANGTGRRRLEKKEMGKKTIIASEV